jgi:hypothetical protein
MTILPEHPKSKSPYLLTYLSSPDGPYISEKSLLEFLAHLLYTYSWTGGWKDKRLDGWTEYQLI